MYTYQLVSIVSLGMTWTPSLKPTTVFPGSSTWVPTPGELLVWGPVVWDSRGTMKSNNPFHFRGFNRNPNHRDPKHQLYNHWLMESMLKQRPSLVDWYGFYCTLYIRGRLWYLLQYWNPYSVISVYNECNILKADYTIPKWYFSFQFYLMHDVGTTTLNNLLKFISFIYFQSVHIYCYKL